MGPLQTGHPRAETTGAAETPAGHRCPDPAEATEPFTGRAQSHPADRQTLTVQVPAAVEGVIHLQAAAALQAAILPAVAAPAEATPQVAAAVHPAATLAEVAPTQAVADVQADLPPEGNYKKTLFYSRIL